MEVHIEFNPANRQYGIWFYREVNGKTEVILPMEMVSQVIDVGDDTGGPSLSLPRMDGEALFQALANTLDQKGYRPDSLAQMQGKMEAQKYHLEDMRNLVFPQPALREVDPS